MKQKQNVPPKHRHACVELFDKESENDRNQLPCVVAFSQNRQVCLLINASVGELVHILLLFPSRVSDSVGREIGGVSQLIQKRNSFDS